MPYPKGFDRGLSSPGPDIKLLRMSNKEAARALTKQYEGYAKEHPDGWKGVDIPAKVKKEIAGFPAYRKNLEIADVATWYDWNIRNWGTKWSACDAQKPQFENDRSKSVLFYFQTAWSPPEPVILAASERFPELTFTLKYWECGCAFKGILKCKNGEVLRNETSDYEGHRGG